MRLCVAHMAYWRLQQAMTLNTDDEEEGVIEDDDDINDTVNDADDMYDEGDEEQVWYGEEWVELNEKLALINMLERRMLRIVSRYSAAVFYG